MRPDHNVRQHVKMANFLRGPGRGNIFRQEWPRACDSEGMHIALSHFKIYLVQGGSDQCRFRRKHHFAMEAMQCYHLWMKRDLHAARCSARAITHPCFVLVVFSRMLCSPNWFKGTPARNFKWCPGTSWNFL